MSKYAFAVTVRDSLKAAGFQRAGCLDKCMSHLRSTNTVVVWGATKADAQRILDIVRHSDHCATVSVEFDGVWVSLNVDGVTGKRLPATKCPRCYATLREDGKCSRGVECADTPSTDDDTWRLTSSEWRTMSRDFRSIVDGKPMALRMVPHKGTCLVPVEIVK